MWRLTPISIPFLLAALTPVQAQTTQTQIEPDSYLSARRLAITDSKRSELVNDDRSSTLFLARSLADKTLALRDVRARSVGVARMADLLWSQDEQYARTLFEKAVNATSNRESTDDTRLLSSLRRRVIVILARRDSDWAERLIAAATQTGNSGEDSKLRSAMSLSTAQSLLEADPELAVKFAEHSLQQSITPAFLDFLSSLRKSNHPAADALFLQALAAVGQDGSPNIGQLHNLALYLFTSPNLLDSDLYAITRVGNIMVPNIAAQRPGVSPGLVQQYLRTAGAVLWRAAPDQAQKQYSYALAYLLLPKARSAGPDLARPIEATMSAIVSDVPPSLTDDSAYKYINAAPASAEDRFDSAEKKPDQESREVAYLDLALWAWHRNDFSAARVANDRIANLELHRKLSVVIDFGEGASSMKHDPKQIETVRIAVDKLPQGIERAILSLSIAAASAKTGDFAQAEEAVDTALKASRSVEDARRPFLMLLAAGQLAEIHSPNLQVVLPQAIKDLNSFDEASLASVEWAQNLQAGELQARFPLEAPNVDPTFSKAFHRAVSGDLEAAISRAEELKNEYFRAQGFVEVAAIHLERLPKATQDQPAIVVGEDGMRQSAAKKVMPAYPEDAIKKRQQGVAVVEVQFDRNGDVTKASALEAPAKSIGEAVIQAVKQWKFVPSKTLDGKPVNIRGKLTFYFEIDEAGKGRVENPKQFR